MSWSDSCENCPGGGDPSRILCLGSVESYAEVAQLVEHDLAKVGVAGSSPVFRSDVVKVGVSPPTACLNKLHVRFPLRSHLELDASFCGMVGTDFDEDPCRSRFFSSSAGRSHCPVENSTKRAPWRCERLEEVVLVADVARDALLTKKRPRVIIALGESLGFDGAELGRREVVGGSGGRRPASQPSLGFDPTVSSSPRAAATRIGSALDACSLRSCEPSFARIEWTMRSEISCSCSIDLIDQSGANAARALTQRERFRPGCASSS